jgi:hypothetical protein
MQPKTEAEYLIVASDPSTPSDVLLGLWNEADSFTCPLSEAARQEMKHAIAKNPNLPLSLIPYCFGYRLTSFSENPALPLLILGNPNLCDDLPEETISRLLKDENSPVIIIELLKTHPARWVQESARLHRHFLGDASEAQIREEIGSIPIKKKDKRMDILNSWGLIPSWLVEKHQLGTAATPSLPTPISPTLNHEPLTEDERAEAMLLLQRVKLRQLRGMTQYGEIQAKTLKIGAKVDLLRLLADHHCLHCNLSNCASFPIDLLKDLGATKEILARTDATIEDKTGTIAGQLGDQLTGLVSVLRFAHCLRTNYQRKILHDAVLSSSWHYRLGAALNPRLTDTERNRLCADSNAIVRAVARDTTLRDRLMERALN